MDNTIKQGVLVKDSESRVINGPDVSMQTIRPPYQVGRCVDLPGKETIVPGIKDDFQKAIDEARRAPSKSDDLKRLVEATRVQEPASTAEATARKDPLLAERGKTHGNWGVNAGVSQAIKKIMRDECGTLPAPLQEALDVICTKLGRIAAGDALFYDHWKDIAGYAKLAEAYCDEIKPRDA